MLIGEHRHTIDAKNRLSLPAKFRKEIGKKVVITFGLDNCLFVYRLKEWEEVAGKLSASSFGQANTRAFNRHFLGGAVETDVDAMGRILIPDYQREFAGLKTKVVVAGVHSRLEIWDEDKWKEFTGRIKGEADTLAEKLSEIGAI
ncbi:MAG: transcriptional regulator MraZ [Patescibacteria group bacterium]|nr:transcriptional regulator MraZ [Patescibacteria group bacterium]